MVKNVPTDLDVRSLKVKSYPHKKNNFSDIARQGTSIFVQYAYENSFDLKTLFPYNSSTFYLPNPSFLSPTLHNPFTISCYSAERKKKGLQSPTKTSQNLPSSRSIEWLGLRRKFYSSARSGETVRKS